MNEKYHAQYKYKNKMKNNPEYKAKEAEYRREYARRRAADVKIRWMKQRTRAKRENRKFNLSLERYNEMIQDGCHYCGADLKAAKGGSLDRKNNNNPNYTTRNVVACCTDCNNLKNYQLTVDETVYVVKQLKKYRKKFGAKKYRNRNITMHYNKKRENR